MKLTICKRVNDSIYTPYSNNRKILEEFIKLKADCAEITEYGNKTAYSCANSLNSSIKTYKMSGMRAVVRERRCYLIKEKSKK